MKVVINKCYGGFGISPEGALWLWENGFDEPEFKTPIDKYFGNKDHAFDSYFGKTKNLENWREYLESSNYKKRKDALFLTAFTPDEKYVLSMRPENRIHPLIVKMVEKLKDKSYGACAELKVVEIPDGTEYEIDEYDGMETIHEVHQSWS